MGTRTVLECGCVVYNSFSDLQKKYTMTEYCSLHDPGKLTAEKAFKMTKKKDR